MAAPPQPRPDVGDILVVIHDFQARSSDELTLAKGDRVQLLERDDEFGDGWFLGKQIVSANTGLFPEVYTRPSPKGLPNGANAIAAGKQNEALHITTPSGTTEHANPMLQSAIATVDGPDLSTTSPSIPAQLQTVQTPLAPSSAPADDITAVAATSSATPTPTASRTEPSLAMSPAAPSSSLPKTSQAPLPVAGNLASAARLNTSKDSQVLHETLNVIDEHITDLRSPSGSNGALQGAAADSGSEYSSNLGPRMSYIQGEETDEEEDGAHTKSEVESWSPDDVAEYLFTVGVEKRHCEVFRDQEISGEVLLGMDQSSLFIDAFDLGPVGRRLKTWQKIKALQDEISNQGGPTASSTRRNTQTYGSDVGSDDARRSVRSRTNTLTSSSNMPNLQQRLPTISDRPISIHSRHLSYSQTPKMEPARPLSPDSPISPRGLLDGSVSAASPGRAPLHEKRPSAASVRDLHHSRRHSSTDYRQPSTSLHSPSDVPRLGASGSYAQPDPFQQQQHKKHPSFDRNWTLGSASPIAEQQQPQPSVPMPLAQQQVEQKPQPQTQLHYHNRPLSSAGLPDVLAGSDLDLGLGALPKSGLGFSTSDYDRGYFSGTDADSRRKSFLQKKQRESLIRGSRGLAANPPSSYAEEQRVRSATALARHSRFGSVDSVRDPSISSPAAQKYFGTSVNGNSTPHRRTTSTNTTDSSIRPMLPAKDGPPQLVTRLDDSRRDTTGTQDYPRPLPASPISPLTNRHGMHGDWFSGKPGFKSSGFGLRALSDAVSGHERVKIASPSSHVEPFPKDSPVLSPSRTGSSTPSGGPSFEFDSPDAKSPSTAATGASSARSLAARKRGKKETSAYQRGLQKISPREAMLDADYSGWMKKKSSNLMATWKPRLFFLKGRRLAYYYSEDDDQEKGLIDISFHRVLPADNERLTGLHATLTGASATPTVPTNSHVPTLAATEANAERIALHETSTSSPDSIFIFKLVPPRAGLSRAVNFTKPMVHYFAVPNIKQGRLWMAALMKATIDRDDTVAVTTTYQQKTISLAKARQMRHRPPALMNLDEKLEGSGTFPHEDRDEDEDDYDANVLGDEEKKMLAAAIASTNARKLDKPTNGLGITYNAEKDNSGAPKDGKSEKLSPYKAESARARQFIFEPEKEDDHHPMSA